MANRSEETTLPDATPPAPPEPETSGDRRAVTGQLAEDDAAYVSLPIAQLFEHPANRARLYGAESLADLQRLHQEDPRGIYCYPLVATLAANWEGKRVRVCDLVSPAALATNRSLADYVDAHPEVKSDKRPAYFVTHGNHRLKVYRSEGLTHVPAITKTMSREEQLISCVNGNQGRPLSRLEIGRFYLEDLRTLGQKKPGRRAKGEEAAGVSQHTFARRIGKSAALVNKCVAAAELYETLPEELQVAITDYNGQVERFTPDHFVLLERLSPTAQIAYAWRVIQYGASASQLGAIIDLEARRVDPALAIQAGLPGAEIARYLSGAAYETGAPGWRPSLAATGAPDGTLTAEEPDVVVVAPGAPAATPTREPLVSTAEPGADLSASFQQVTQTKPRPDAAAKRETAAARREAKETKDYGDLLRKIEVEVRVAVTATWDALRLMQGLKDTDWALWSDVIQQMHAHYAPQFQTRGVPVPLSLAEGVAEESGESFVPAGTGAEAATAG